MRIVPVNLNEKSYNIYIAHNLETTIINFFKAQKYSQKALIITDTNIAPLYADSVKDLLTKAGFNAKIAIIPAGEQSKSLSVAETLYTQAIEHGLDRKSPIIALGGGVVGDLAVSLPLPSCVVCLSFKCQLAYLHKLTLVLVAKSL